MTKRLQSIVYFEVTTNVVIKGCGLRPVGVPIHEELILDREADALFEAVDQRRFIQARAFFLLREQLIVLDEGTGLLEGIPKVFASIGGFMRISAYMPEGAKVLRKGRDSADTTFSIWHHKNGSSFPNG